MSVSIWISQHWSVDECLCFLANKLYFGHGFRGINQAAKGFFQKNPADLSTDEICMLIAVTIDPTSYEINNHNEKLIIKSNEIKTILLKSKNWNSNGF